MLAAVLYCCIRFGPDGLFMSLKGLFLGMALFIVFYFMGGMGAGDVKLMGFIGAVIGPEGVIYAALFTSIAGGFYAFIILLLKGGFKLSLAGLAMNWKTFLLTRQFVFIPSGHCENKKERCLCYGLAISIGTFIYIILKWSGNPYVT